MRVAKLMSTRTLVPFSYYSLAQCTPRSLEAAAENLGEVLHGDRIFNAPFELRLRRPRALALCRLLLDPQERELWVARIREGYRAHLLLDNLPVGTRRPRDGAAPLLERGYLLGAAAPDGAIVHNHLHFTVRYHLPSPSVTTGEAWRGSGRRARIVGFEVEPSSRGYTHAARWPDDSEGEAGSAVDVLNLSPAEVGLSHDGTSPMVLRRRGGKPVELIFTYNVTYALSEVPYSSRWDNYLMLEEGSQVHWLSLCGSLALSLLLASLVAAIMLATVRRDLQKYNAIDADDDLVEVGWKYTHADVLRPPAGPLSLSCALGAAVQLICSGAVTLALALLGVISPTARGRLLTAALLLLCLSAVPAGYVAARLYRQIDGSHPYALIGALSFALPGSVFAAFTALDLVLWARGASSAVPLTTLLALLLLWLGLHVPLLATGASLGFRQPRAEDPCFTNLIPRQIPTQPLWAHPLVAALSGGLLPFGSAAIELSSLYSSAWNGRIYSLFGFLFLTATTTALICAEVGVVLCYFQLCREDYRWWWRSFAHTGSCGLYFFLHAAAYAHSELHLSGPTAIAIYYGYTAAASAALSLVTGGVSFVACFWFVRSIFAAVKVD